MRYTIELSRSGDEWLVTSGRGMSQAIIDSFPTQSAAIDWARSNIDDEHTLVVRSESGNVRTVRAGTDPKDTSGLPGFKELERDRYADFL